MVTQKGVPKRRCYECMLKDFLFAIFEVEDFLILLVSVRIHFRLANDTPTTFGKTWISYIVGGDIAEFSSPSRISLQFLGLVVITTELSRQISRSLASSPFAQPFFTTNFF